jgi:hypothetical protein
MKVFIFFMIITLLMRTVALSAAELSDSDAKKLLEKLWNPSPVYTTLGSLDVKSQDIETSASPYGWLQANAKVGLITIQEDQCLKEWKAGPGKKIREFSQVCQAYYMQQHDSGVVGKIIVQKTPKGEELAQKSGLQQQKDSLVMNQGVFTVDKIVKNEAQKKGVDEYRIVMCTYKAQWTPEYKQVRAILGNSLSEDWKAIILLKFDPFKSEWVWIASDVVNKDAEFTTNNVSKKLSE